MGQRTLNPQGKLDFGFISIEPEIIEKKNAIPGPGTYGAGLEINKYGYYPVSTYSDSKAARWSPSKKRFPPENKNIQEIPGPGSYNPNDYIAGNYILSTHRNSGTRKYA